MICLAEVLGLDGCRWKVDVAFDFFPLLSVRDDFAVDGSLGVACRHLMVLLQVYRLSEKLINLKKSDDHDAGQQNVLWFGLYLREVGCP